MARKHLLSGLFRPAVCRFHSWSAVVIRSLISRFMRATMFAVS